MRIANCITNDEGCQESLRSFNNWLLRLGEGKLPNVAETVFDDVIELPAEICTNSKDMLIRHVYQDLENRYVDHDWLAGRILLAPKNSVVDELNNEVMQKLPGQSIVVRSIDSVSGIDQASLYPVEFLNSINLSGLPPHEMHLKINAPIMLLRNLDPSGGHCNGTRYILTAITETLLHARILGGEQAGSIILIPRILMSSSDADLPFQLIRRQFPIRPAFAMTINKSQGQTFQRCGVHLSTNVFTHGQLYVAASRYGNPLDLKIFIGRDNVHRSSPDTNNNYNLAENSVHRLTRNVVYREVFQY